MTMARGKLSPVKVWDVAIRLFHWALVSAFAFAAYSAFQDKFGIYADMHLYAGLSVLTLVLWRIVWGVVGSDTARFASFVKGPAAIRAYLHGQGREGLGHNPLGALSVLLMLVLLLAQAAMGLFASDDMFFSGPLAESAGDGLSGMLTKWHRLTGYALMALASLHFLAVLWYRLARRTDLVTPMITGRKQVFDPGTAPKMAPLWRAALAFGLCALAVWWTLIA